MRADARRNRERILDVAEQALAEDGAHFSMDAVARRAGLGAGTLYRHFPTREVLLAAVLEERGATVPSADDLLARHDSAADALRAWLVALLHWTHGCTDLAQPLLDAADREEEATPMGLHCAALIGTADRLLVAAQDEGAARRDLDGATLYRAALGLAWASRGEPEPQAYLALLERGWALGMRPTAG